MVARSLLAMFYANFHCFRDSFRYRSRLFRIRRGFRMVIRSDFVMITLDLGTSHE